MKKTIRFTAAALLSVAMFSQGVFANVGDMGFFGGISEGRRLPGTTELMLKENVTKKKNETASFVYKEMMFLTGSPIEFEGLMTIKASGDVTDTTNIGTYTVTYNVDRSDTTSEDNNIRRTLTFTVNWRREGQQVIKDYSIRTWSETVTANGVEYRLDPKQSYYNISILEDHTASVVYYKGDVSMRSVYINPDNESNSPEDATVLETSGSLYGYNCAWSSTETHRLDSTVFTNDWQLQYQIRPSVSVNKLLQYSANEPTLISFPGNYREVMQNDSGMSYDIFILPQQFYNTDTEGKSNIATYNAFEQLPATDTAYLKGHSAEEDIKKLFSMQVLTGDPRFYIPSQAITRGQFVTALLRAVKIPVEIPQVNAKSKKVQPIVLTFPDVMPDNPNYPYVMAAYNAGLAVGRENGYFYSDASVDRQEAIAILIRSLGLENFGLEPTGMTVFTDDSKVSSWAKREVYVAEQIGLIAADEDGNIRPREYMSKAEAAAIINRLIDYMRYELKTDYTEHIVNYSN